MRPFVSDAFMKVCIVSNNTQERKQNHFYSVIGEKMMHIFLKFSAFILFFLNKLRKFIQ